jgi:hypothetical protein
VVYVRESLHTVAGSGVLWKGREGIRVVVKKGVKDRVVLLFTLTFSNRASYI